MVHGYQIGAAAKASGLTIDTIRFYQKSGLLKPPRRTNAGYRVFTDADLKELEFIAKAQNLGFSLAEIKELMLLREDNSLRRACPEMRGMVERKLGNIKKKIAALRQLESELTRARRACSRALNTGTADAGCPAMNRIANGTFRQKQ